MKYMKQVNLLLLACAVFLLICGCNSTKSNRTLTGSWVLDFSQMTKEDSDFQALFDDDYDFLHSFSLYEDDTYSANMFDAHEVINGASNGSYTIVHDGTSISFDDRAYYQFEQAKDTLTIYGEQGGVYVYNRAGTVDGIGMYRLCERDGQPSMENSILELREDHLMVDRSLGDEGYLDEEITWRWENDKMIFSDGSGLSIEGVMVENQLSITDGTHVLVFERISSNDYQ